MKAPWCENWRRLLYKFRESFPPSAIKTRSLNEAHQGTVLNTKLKENDKITVFLLTQEHGATDTLLIQKKVSDRSVSTKHYVLNDALIRPIDYFYLLKDIGTFLYYKITIFFLYSLYLIVIPL